MSSPQWEPLEKRIAVVNSGSPNEKTVLLLDPSRQADRQFVAFRSLPDDPSDRASVDEWLERAAFIEEDLHWLLQLEHDQFWCQAIHDETLTRCIDSFLQYAPRPYNDWMVREFKQEVQDKVDSLCKLMFLTCVRMATHKESKEHFITPSVFGDILYENFLYDIPKLMDLCAIYSLSNEAMLKKMVGNIFKQQPKYHSEDLQQTVPTLAQVLGNVSFKCGIQDTPGTPQLVKISQKKTVGTLSNDELTEVVSYLLDVSFTLHSFLEVYPPAADVFVEQTLTMKLVTFYENTMTEIGSELKKRKSNLTRRFSMARRYFVQIVRSVIQKVYLNPIMENSTDCSAGESIENYFGLMTSLVGEPRFTADYERMFPFREDLDILTQVSHPIDETRLEFLEEGIHNAYFSVHKGRRSDPSTRQPEKNQESICDQKPGASNTGLDGVSGRTTVSATSSGPTVSGIELASLVSSVKDLLPDLGDGFTELCLSEFEYNVEKVINAVLEDNLPQSLKDVDRQLPAADSFPTEEEPVSLLKQRHNVYDNDEFDVFNREDVDLSRIHRGKKNKGTGSFKSVLDDKTAKLFMRSDVMRYDVIKDTVYGDNMYDDEYDDTYDDNAIGADDADSADELRRPFTTPRVLGSDTAKKVKPIIQSEESEEEDDVRRDQFVANPEELRQKAAQRLADKHGRPPPGRRQLAGSQQHASRQQPAGSQQHAGSHQPGGTQQSGGTQRDVIGQPKGQGQDAKVLKNRDHKEKHKGSSSNHNRRRMADRKMSKGMY